MSVRHTQEVKALRSRLTAAEVELTSAREITKDAQRSEAAALRKRDGLKAQIDELEASNRDVVVTEHALLRYIERIYKIDLEILRSDILSESVMATIDKFPSGKIPITGGRLVVKDRTIITVEN